MTFYEFAKKYVPNKLSCENTKGCPYIMNEYFSFIASSCGNFDNCVECWNQEINDTMLKLALAEMNDSEGTSDVSKDYITLHQNSEPITMRKSAVTSILQSNGKTFVVCGSASTTVDESYDDVVRAVFS